MFDVSDLIARMPEQPGVYLMKGHAEEIIYVGKARNLKARVRQYFQASGDPRYFVHLLDKYLNDIEVIITSNEKEAFILENELIKRHQPRFNIELKDDKSFLHIRIDTRVPWPKIQIVRRPRRDGAQYFGPFHSATKLRSTVKIIERYFGLRTCDDLAFKNRSRPCIQYQIKRCPGPCVLPVDAQDYARQVAEVSLFLRGQTDELIRSVTQKMTEAASTFNYELAARYRDQIQAISGSLESQKVVQFNNLDRDVYGIYREGAHLQITILMVRQGRMVGSKNFGFEGQGVKDDEVISTVCNLYYSGGASIPNEVVLPILPNDVDALAEYLTDLKQKVVRVWCPKKGIVHRLLELAVKNAEHAFFQARREEARRDGGLVRLKQTLRLDNVPYRIECFDISLFQGGSPVGSQVVFEGGVPLRRGYRHFKIKSVEGTDDYAMLREVLSRRLKRGLDEQNLPDLIVIDGGKGQLNVALTVLRDLAIDGVDVVSLAKARTLQGNSSDAVLKSSERVFVPGLKDPIILRAHTDEFFLMTHLRNEAHRFAITFHRKRRGRQSIKSALNDMPGLGPKRRKALLSTFGSVEKLKTASVEELTQIEGIGPKLACEIFKFLKTL